MKEKIYPYWLKGGVIGFALSIFVWGDTPLFYKFLGFTKFLYICAFSIVAFGIGALIGLIFDKMKER